MCTTVKGHWLCSETSPHGRNVKLALDARPKMENLKPRWAKGFAESISGKIFVIDDIS